MVGADMSQGKALSKGERSVQCNIRWTPDLYGRLKAHAEFHGLPVSEAVRRLVAQGMGLLPLDSIVLDAQESGHES